MHQPYTTNSIYNTKLTTAQTQNSYSKIINLTSKSKITNHSMWHIIMSWYILIQKDTTKDKKKKLQPRHKPILQKSWFWSWGQRSPILVHLCRPTLIPNKMPIPKDKKCYSLNMICYRWTDRLMTIWPIVVKSYTSILQGLDNQLVSIALLNFQKKKNFIEKTEICIDDHDK